MFDPDFDETPIAIIPRHASVEPTTVPATKNTKTVKKSSSISKIFGSKGNKEDKKNDKKKSKSKSPEPEKESALEF